MHGKKHAKAAGNGRTSVMVDAETSAALGRLAKRDPHDGSVESKGDVVRRLAQREARRVERQPRALAAQPAAAET